MKHAIATCIALILTYQVLPARALDTLSTRIYPSQKFDSYIAAMGRTADSGLIIVSNINGERHKNGILKLNKNLDIQWQGRYGDTIFIYNKNDTAFSYENYTIGVLETSKRDYLVFDLASVPLNVLDTALWFITIFSGDGQEKNRMVFPNQTISLVKKFNGSIYGLVRKGTHYNYSTFITQFDEQANILREIPIASIDSVMPYDFFPINGGFICYGVHYITSPALKSISLLYKLDLNGQLVWKQKYGNYSEELATQAIKLTDNGSIIDVLVSYS